MTIVAAMTSRAAVRGRPCPRPTSALHLPEGSGTRAACCVAPSPARLPRRPPGKRRRGHPCRIGVVASRRRGASRREPRCLRATLRVSCSCRCRAPSPAHGAAALAATPRAAMLRSAAPAEGGETPPRDAPCVRKAKTAHRGMRGRALRRLPCRGCGAACAGPAAGSQGPVGGRRTHAARAARAGSAAGGPDKVRPVPRTPVRISRGRRSRTGRRARIPGSRCARSADGRKGR